jgi:hypothetical protein
MPRAIHKAVFLLVLALVLHGAGLSFWWQWDLWCARQDAWSETDKKMTVELVLSKQEFYEQRVDQRELWFQGCLYDLRKWEIGVDSVRVRAYRDRKEEYLYQQGKRLFAALSSPASSQEGTIAFFIRLLYSAFVLPDFLYWLLSNQGEDASSQCFVIVENWLHVFQEAIDPPPEVSVFRQIFR